MTGAKIQSLASLEAEMRAVARGEQPAPPDAAGPSFNSVLALARLLTPENRALLALIRDRKPRSIAELARWTGRAGPNLTRTLDKLAVAGLVTLTEESRRTVPTARVGRIRIDIDPFADDDRLELEGLR
jgi:predicted transcriptional regulator